MNNYKIEYERWLTSNTLTDEELAELKTIKDNEDEIKVRFSSDISFGTAGLRSTMCLGTANMNRFTVAQTTKAIAALIKSQNAEKRGVVIAFDSRNNSALFANVSAGILAAEGVKVYLFDALRPTPELSFAVRHLGAIAGINITASHNPKEYNGYKAYWEDGAQISPDQAAAISELRSEFDILDLSNIMSVDDGKKSGMIVLLDELFDSIYLEAVRKTAVCPENISKVSNDLKVVYTPLHGAGYKLVPRVFKESGLLHLYTVDEQMVSDGDFPTVKKPNPEYPETFKLGIDLADRVGSDIVIATDPDADRVGVMARSKDGSFVTISGNQMGALLLDYVIKQRKERGTLASNAYCVKSIVSTDMAYKIADVNGIKLHDVLTGFKFIGEVIKNYEKRGDEDGFILGFEESYGYLLGSYARDKDAVEASMMILEMTAYYKMNDMTLIDALNNLYLNYGFYSEKMIDVYMEGVNGVENRKKVMSGLRNNIPSAIGGCPVKSVGDYIEGCFTNLSDGVKTPTDQPVSDVIYYILENDDKIIVRPSGTEPKIKIYILAHGESMDIISSKSAKYESDIRKITEV